MAPCLKLGFNNADKVERKSELVIKQSAASQQFWIRQCGFPQWQPSPQTHLIIPTSTTHPIQSTHPIHPSHPTHPLVIISSILPCPTTCPLQARALYCQNVKHQINAYAMISLLAKQLFFWSRPNLFVFSNYFLTISQLNFFHLHFRKYQNTTQLSNLWQIPNSVRIGFCPAMKMGLSRQFQRYSTT